MALAVVSSTVDKPSFTSEDQMSLRFQLYENGPMCTMIIAKDHKATLVCDKAQLSESK